MPVDTPRKEYSAALGKWERCRDFADGQDAVKAKRELYLPRTSIKQKAPLYEAFLRRAFFYGATSRTIQGLGGAAFAKSPTTQAPDATLKAASDITQSGISLEGFAHDVITEVLTVGRHGALVDMPSDGGAELRPYWVPYLAQNIVNWRTAMQAGDTILTRVVLKECVEEPDPKDQWASVDVIQYRVLELTVDGAYEVATYRQGEQSKEWTETSRVRPVRRGEALQFIPFQFFGPSRLTTDIERPPLIDLVDANLAHYQLWADRRQMLHYMGQVQPWVSGVAKKDTPTEWGSGVVWSMESPDAQAGLLQVGSDGAAPLREVLQDLEQTMAILGGRLLEPQVRKQEAAETVHLRRSADVVVLRSLAHTAATGLSQMLRWHAWWAGELTDPQNQDVSFSLNTDFAATRLTAEEIKALVLAVQAGRISGATFYHALTRGDWAEPGVTWEAEQERLKVEEPEIEDDPGGDDNPDEGAIA